MNNEPLSIAKITRPGATGIAPRERLFTLLDKGREKTVLWVSAPAGSGKTSLVSSWLTSRNLPNIWYQIDAGERDPATFFYYLGQAKARMNQQKQKLLPLFTPEFLHEIPAFTRRFFEELCQPVTDNQQSSESSSFPILVLDNHHEVPPETVFHDILQHGLATVPEGMTVIIISRGGPPPELTRLRANSRMGVLGWSDLRFTLEESHALLKLHGIHETEGQIARNLHDRTDGWAAGLILLKENVNREHRGNSVSGSNVSQEMFDYFANEIFQRTLPETRRFLLTTSFFPSVSAAMAERLTGMREARSILAELSRNHYFTDWKPLHTPVYQYHPLFSDFLRTRAREVFTSKELERILLDTAALLLETNSRAEAVELLAEARDFNAIASVIVASAQALIEQGRNRTLLQWLSYLPQEIIRRDPWLSYWQGTALHSFDLHTSEQYYREAFHGFVREDDKIGALLAWSGISVNIIVEWRDFSRMDQQISWLTEDIERQVDVLPVDLRARIVGVVLVCFSFRQPWHQNVIIYEERAEALIRNGCLKLESLVTLGSFLLIHYTKTGLLAKTGVLMDVIEPRTINRENSICLELVLWRMLSASCYALTANKRECLARVDQALELAASTGVHVYDIYMLFYGAMAGFIDFDQKIVDTYFERITSLQGSDGLIYPIVYRQIMGWKQIVAGNHTVALEHVETALEMTLALGAPIEIAINAIARTQLLFEVDRRDEARRCLAVVGTGNAIHSAYVRFMFSCTSAWFAFKEADDASGLELLREAMQIGSRERILMHHFWTPRIMTTLCSKALEAGIEVKYVRELIARHRLTPEVGQIKNEQWPWPLRIHTLGRFDLVLQSERLVFSGKKQEKPLSLLKAIVAYGGRAVPAETLCDTLWPATAGDSARSSLKMTLSRLRRLLGDDRMIEMREGKLTLNHGLCWVDAWAFNDMAGKIDALLREDEQEIVVEERILVGLMDDIVRMYAGEFLHGEKIDFGEITYRNRLQRTFLGLLKKICGALERSQRWDLALGYYRKAHEIDPLAEEFYQRLMVCHQRIGQKGEAVAVYKQCRTTLQTILGITPSHQTEEILKNIMAS